MATSYLENIVPLEFANEARDLSMQEFFVLHGDTAILGVDLKGDELRAGLLSTLGAKGSTLQPSLSVLGYDTVVQSSVSDLASAIDEATEHGAEDLKRLLFKGPHYFLPLRKREGDIAYMQRISVGRARNKDVVLRHEGISKFHAWFEVDEDGRFYLADAGSRNGTRVRGESITPRQLVRVSPGDALEFGKVSCCLCTPETFWRLMHD